MKRVALLTLACATALVAGHTSAPASARHATSAATAARNLVTIRPMVHPLDAALASPPTTATCKAQYHFACYNPLQLEKAYDLLPLYKQGYDGTGRTIVIVDSFGSPTVGHDLAVFDKQYGLPAPPSLRVIQPAGKFPKEPDHPGWAWETALDVEWAHAIAPGANILLVETPTNEDEGTSGFPQIVEAENYVVDHNLGDVISQSFGATEQTFPGAKQLLAQRGAYINAHDHNVSVLAASSDSGAVDYTRSGGLYTYPVVDWPGTDPLITNVSGTELHLNAAGTRTSPDTVWNDTFNKAVQRYFDGSPAPTATGGGGGKSIFFARPPWQAGVKSITGNHRGVPDISMSASCAAQVVVYVSFPGTRPGWSIICGTSEATPEFAGIVAIADQYAGKRLGLLNPALYSLSAAGAPGLVDVTQGNNSVRFQQDGTWYNVAGFSASPGYDLASGVGTVDAAKLVPELAAASN
jgi:subtilase family serine protease